jgi:uncharacterized protein YjbI with pentapeptide repeats
MADEEHLARLKEGVKMWNSWREVNRDVQPDLTGADLTGADLTEAAIGWTSFADMDLSTARGLEIIHHWAPSTIGINTLYRSHGNIPEAFLRGAGVPDDFIAYV